MSQRDASTPGQARVGNLTHLSDGPVRIHEVWLQECIEQVASHPLDGVVDGQHMDALAIFDVGALQAH